MSDKTPAQLANDVAGAVRALNRATSRSSEDWAYPNQAYDVVGTLAYVAHALDQSLDQVRLLIAKLAADGRIEVRSPDGPKKLEDFDVNALSAAESVKQLAKAMDAMHSALSPMAYKEV